VASRKHGCHLAPHHPPFNTCRASTCRPPRLPPWPEKTHVAYTFLFASLPTRTFTSLFTYLLPHYLHTHDTFHLPSFSPTHFLLMPTSMPSASMPLAHTHLPSLLSSAASLQCTCLPWDIVAVPCPAHTLLGPYAITNSRSGGDETWRRASIAATLLTLALHAACCLRAFYAWHAAQRFSTCDAAHTFLFCCLHARTPPPGPTTLQPLLAIMSIPCALIAVTHRHSTTPLRVPTRYAPARRYCLQRYRAPLLPAETR